MIASPRAGRGPLAKITSLKLNSYLVASPMLQKFVGSFFMMLLTILSYKMIYYNTKKIFVVSNTIL